MKRSRIADRHGDVTFAEEVDVDMFEETGKRDKIDEVDEKRSDVELRLRVEGVMNLARLASKLDLFFVSEELDQLGLLPNTFSATRDNLDKRKDDWMLVNPSTSSDPRLASDSWAFAKVPTRRTKPGLICLRNPLESHLPLVQQLSMTLQQSIDDHYYGKQQMLSHQLAVELGRQAQNETLLDTKAPGKSKRNMDRMGNVDLDVTIFANAAEYLSRILPKPNGCVIIDLSEFRMTVDARQNRSQESSHVGSEGVIDSNTGNNSVQLEEGQSTSSPQSITSAQFSTVRPSFHRSVTDTTSAEQSVVSEGGKTHCSYILSASPVRVLGSYGQDAEHFERLDGTVSKPIIAQYLSMTRKSGLNSKTLVERRTSSPNFNLDKLAPASANTYLCSSVAEADSQPAYLLFAFFKCHNIDFTQTEELFVEQVGAYLIYSSIRSRVVAVDRAQMRFTQRIQHELRTPLHAIIGVNEIVKQSLSHAFDLDEMSDMIESIGSSADSLSLLIDDMVDFSLMERLSGERRILQTEKMASDWDTICGVISMTCLTAYQLSQRILRMEDKSRQSQAPPEIFIALPDLYTFDWKEYKAQVDLEVIRRIVWKLVMNAIQATQRGIILVTVSRRKPDQIKEAGVSSERLEIEIADTGKGMEQKFVNEKLFQPFGKEDEESRGVGLSLSICQALVSQLAGRLTAKSKVGQGTEMLVSLPLPKVGNKDAPSSEGHSNGSPAAFVGFDSHNKRLFVDELLKQFCIKENKDIATAPIIVIAIDDPHLSHDCTKEIEVIRSRESKPKIVLMPTIIMRELDEARSTRMDTLELLLGLKTQTIHRPLSIAEVHEFAALIQDTMEWQKSALQINAGLESSLTLPVPMRSSPNATSLELSRRGSMSSEGTQQMDHPYTILVVEDNPLNARIMTTMLKKNGYDYVLATDGGEGVEMFKKYLPQLVLLDINMPIMNGFEACKMMRSLVSPYTHRIIAITALSTEAERRKGKESGMDDWLTKPTRMAPLLRSIRRWKKDYEGLPVSDPSTPSSNGPGLSLVA